MNKYSLQYAIQEGYEFIPMNSEKRSLVEWKNHSSDNEELLKHGLDNISIKVGVNDLVVFDIDSRNAHKQNWMNEEFMIRLKDRGFDFKNVASQKTLSEGVHILCRTDKMDKKDVFSRTTNNKVLVELLSNRQLAIIYSESIVEDILELPYIPDEELQKLIEDSKLT